MSVPPSSDWSGQLIDREELEKLKQTAREAPTKRARICLHQTHEDAIQEMLIALCRDSHVPPHRQQNKSKTYTIIEGVMIVTYYDDCGHRVREFEMGESGSGRAFMVRFPSGQWHTVQAQSPLVVYIEAIAGPYRQEHTEWAPWTADDELK